MPPPASQVVNVNGLWSRPLLPWLQGMRPNSVVQMHDRVVEHARAFQILDQRGGGLVHAGGHVAVVLGEVLVAVPVAAGEAVVGAAPDLHEADAALQQAPGDQAVACRNPRVTVSIEAVELAGWPRIRSAMSSTSGALNCSLRGQFVGGDARVEPGIACARRQMLVG